MNALLNKKLWRDMDNIKGQILAIALVITAGIAVFIVMYGVNQSLNLTKQTYYDRYEFADLFVSLKRAPETVKQRLEEVPGIAKIETRVAYAITLQMTQMVEPGSAMVLSIPNQQESAINQLHLRAGRYPKVGEVDAVMVDEAFFHAHNLHLGDSVSVIMNGFRRQLMIVGVALSPEFVYSLAPGAMMPDPKRFAVFWMRRMDLEAAINMKGAFNDLLIKVQREANLTAIKSTVDTILKPYGGLLTIERKDQTSNFYLENELKQLKTMGDTVPIIFMVVAAFLINVVVSRQIATQRVQIGMLKAVGYTDWEVAWHFIKMVLLIVAVGSVLGLVIGTWAAGGMVNMYAQFFHFPLLKYAFSTQVMALAVLICLIAALLGALIAVRKAIQLAPAEAMRPASPERYQRSWIDRFEVLNGFNFLSRIVIRQLIRRPIRSALSTLGLAMAMAILVYSFQMQDTMNHMMNLQFNVAQREDLSVTFSHPKPSQVLEDLQSLPGVMRVEGVRHVPVEYLFGHIKKRGQVSGLIEGHQLKRVLGEDMKPIRMPESGLVINQILADQLGIAVGDSLTLEVLEDNRPTFQITVAATTKELFGIGSYLTLKELSLLLDESPRFNGASILVDQKYADQLYQKLKNMPAIQGLNITSVTQQKFTELLADNIMKMMAVIVVFASFISVGVVYNTARIALSERGRELASLRVLGLTRKEVAFLLFGELLLMAMIAIPLGIYLGDLMAVYMFSSMDSELYRIPVYVSRKTYGLAAAFITATVLLSFYLVWQRVDDIDLVSAQKGVE